MSSDLDPRPARAPHPLLPIPQLRLRHGVACLALVAGFGLPTGAHAQQDAGVEPPGADSELTPRALELDLGVGAFRRTLRYNDDIFRRLQSYTLKTGPWVEGNVAFYPGALSTDTNSAVSWFGVAVSYGQALGLDSERFEGETFQTSSRAYGVDLKARVPLSAHRLIVSAGYGRRLFQVENIEPQNALYPAEPGVPDADYQFVRLGVSFEFQAVETLTLVSSAGYRGVLDQGDIATSGWFPHASAGGVDFAMQLRYALSRDLDLRAGFELERYFFSLKPELGDEPVAGGALDQYLGVQLGVGYSL